MLFRGGFLEIVWQNQIFILSSLEQFKDKKISACAQGGPGGEVGKALSCQLEDAGSIPAELNTSIPSV